MRALALLFALCGCGSIRTVPPEQMPCSIAPCLAPINLVTVIDGGVRMPDDEAHRLVPCGELPIIMRWDAELQALIIPNDRVCLVP